MPKNRTQIKNAGISSLSGKIVLVTGGARGIGKTVTQTLSSAGADVIIHCNASDKDAYRLLSALGGSGKGHVVRADLSQKEGIERLAEEVGGITHSLDGLVNNAGIYAGTSLSELEFEEWDRVLDTNLRSQVFLIKLLASRLKKASGSVVNISSIMGIAPSAGSYPYQASKSALVHLTRGLAMELAPRVRVNCVAPGFIRTDMNRDGWKDKSFSRMVADRTLLKRWGETADIAGPVRFLLSDEASFITGQTLLVDGGKSLLG